MKVTVTMLPVVGWFPGSQKKRSDNDNGSLDLSDN